MPQQARFQGPVGMNRNRQPDIHSRFAVDVVAPLDPHKLPAVLFNALAKFFAAHLLHTAISTIRASVSPWGG